MSSTPRRSHSPQRGRRGPREIWTGGHDDPLLEPKFASAPRKHHIAGIDAARGFALVAMFAVHMLPVYNDAAGRASLTWLLFAGTASSLFGVLAGAGLGFTTGGASPYTGRRLLQSQVRIILRAIALIIIGVTVNLAPLETFNILVYFAIAFILATPLTTLHVRQLLVLAVILMVTLPVLRYLIHTRTEGAGYYPNPTFEDLGTDPLGVLNTLTISGVYPALTWLAFLTLGIAVGRLVLRWPNSPLILLGSGALIYAVVRTASTLIERSTGGYELIAMSFPGASENQIDDFIVFGPDGELPTSTMGWMLTGGPHTETPLSLMAGASAALAFIGLFMLLTPRFPKVLNPLVTIGRMPATIYLSHLLFLAFVFVWLPSWTLFIIQVLASIVVAYVWTHFFRQGPAEWGMSSFAKLGNYLVPVPPKV